VAVHVGPGAFGEFECDGSSSTARGYVSVIGSGRQQTRFVRATCAIGLGLASLGAIQVHNCQEMDFSHLAAQSYTGAFWVGGGNATWSDVDLVGAPPPGGNTCSAIATLGWYDFVGEGGRSEHHFFGSRVIGKGAANVPLNAGFDTTDAKTWFYGGDIIAEYDVPGSPNVGAGNFAAPVASPAELRVYGSSIRSLVGTSTGATFAPSGLRAVDLTFGGIFHMHGGVINASAAGSTTNVDVSGIIADGTGEAHTPGTAFITVAAGSGTARRTVVGTNGGMIHSPFVWPAEPVPPAAESIHGSDMFVDTASGSANNEAHLMVRDTGCTSAGGPWRDMATGACR